MGGGATSDEGMLAEMQMTRRQAGRGGECRCPGRGKRNRPRQVAAGRWGTHRDTAGDVGQGQQGQASGTFCAGVGKQGPLGGDRKEGSLTFQFTHFHVTGTLSKGCSYSFCNPGPWQNGQEEDQELLLVQAPQLPQAEPARVSRTVLTPRPGTQMPGDSFMPALPRLEAADEL